MRVLRGTADDEEIFALLADYYSLVGQIIEDGGGRVLKYMGDAALIIFPEDCVDSAVGALLDLREQGDGWLKEREFESTHAINAHFGPACVGYVGSKDAKQLDAFGETINIAASRPTHSLSLSTQAFRKLSPLSRKAFKKHTPPLTYIPTDERH